MSRIIEIFVAFEHEFEGTLAEGDTECSDEYKVLNNISSIIDSEMKEHTGKKKKHFNKTPLIQ